MTHLQTKESSEKLSSLYQAVTIPKPMIVPNPPDELVKFRSLSRADKEKGGEKFYAQEYIEQYLEEKWVAELHNRDCFLWLWEGYKHVKDEGKRTVIRAKLTEFKRVISETDRPYRALWMDWSEYRFGEIRDKEETDVCELFSGKVV